MSNFDYDFRALTGLPRPLSWQSRLFADHFKNGDLPGAVDVPTGLGKTMTMAIWLIALAGQLESLRKGGAIARDRRIPRRLVYVVDRRAVVDQATAEAEKLRDALEGPAAHLKALLGLEKRKLPISTLRGAYVDNREWLEDPAAPAIIIGTVDMIGSRLLFEGYGVSRKMRPYHAGLLGADALVVLDEAHLVPPFQHLLHAIEHNAPKWAADDARTIVPSFRLLPLSATQRAAPQSGAYFHLEARDWENDEVAKKRLNAKKRLRFERFTDKNSDKLLADAAWKLATENGPKRVIVFCSRRTKHNEERKELGAGPCADGVAEELRKLTKPGRGEKEPKADIELLVGARRQRERDNVADWLRRTGFIGGGRSPAKPTLLVATSAGEVGVDIDADHMVSDLAPWERMVQRLGRVNRRGEGMAEVVVFWSEPNVKKENEPTKAEERALLAFASKQALEALPEQGAAFDASPLALRRLAENAAQAEVVSNATTPEPLRPALTRPLVEAWSMTSLEQHTGRPEISHWLRGWVEEAPQTALVWRAHLPLRENVRDWPRTKEEKLEVSAFFEAAPPHESEKLETETYHVVDWLTTRTANILKRTPRAPAAQDAGADPDANLLVSADEAAETDVSFDHKADPVEDNASAPPGDAQSGATLPNTPLRAGDVAAIALSPAGDFVRAYTVAKLAEKRDANTLISELAGLTLILDAGFAGLSEDGLLISTRSAAPPTADRDPKSWFKGENPDDPLIRFRIEAKREIDDKRWRFRAQFLRQAAEDVEEEKRFFVFKWRADQGTADDASIIRNQSLPDHSAATQQCAERIAGALGLEAPWRDALVRGAYLHDVGKARRLWQIAMGKPPRAGEPPYAKTDGKGAQPKRLRMNGGVFRHEFASLALTENDEALAKLPEQARDLALHLIVAHHGFARPVIFAFDPEAPPSLTEERAREVALRYARLQKRWGPWGLAWWEALLRAADQQASRALEASAPDGAQEAA